MAAQPEPRRRSSLKWWAAGIIAAVVLVIIAGFAISPLYDNPERQAPPAVQSPSVSDVISHVPTYLGKTITVEGKVGQTISPEAVALANESSGDTTPLLVVGKQGMLPPGLKPGDTVQVVGTLGTFSRPQIEKDAGVTLDPQKFAQYDGKPVVIAQSASKPS